MKLKVLNIIACLFIAACVITSCLDDDNIVYETNYKSSITAFSFDSIVTYYPSVTKEGKDTTLSKYVVGSNYPFIIDQVKGQIYNADSLPVGTDVSRVVVNIQTEGYYIFIEAGEKDTIWINEDSLDFTQPVQFKVLSEMNTFGQIYTAKINVHQQNPDTMSWTRFTGNLSTEIENQKAVYLNGNIIVFSENETQTTVTSTQDGKEWTPLQAINLSIKADYNSAMVWNEKIYILADNALYASENGINWTKVETDQSFSTLTASSKNKLTGTDTDNYYIESSDAINWERHDSMPTDFPNAPFTFTSYALSTNASMERIVLMGNNPVEADTTNVVWGQIDNEHEWAAMTYENNKKLCPKFENPTMIHYNNKLYAFGGPATDGISLAAFEQFYSSKDNGISWEPVTKVLTFPKEFKTIYEQAEGNYSCIVDNDNFIWIIWSKTGEVWRGRINKLGFIKQ